MPKGSETAGSWVTTDPLFVIGNGTAAGASRSTAMMVLKNGNVGIGTTAPATPLHVAGTVARGIQYLKSGSKDARITVGDPTTLWSMASGWGTAGEFSILQEGVAERMHIDSSGNVGIGTAAPAVKMDITGDMYVRNAGTPTAYGRIIHSGSAGNFHLDSFGGGTNSIYLNWISGANAHVGNGAAGYGTIYAAAFTVSSDRRLKTDIKPIENSLDIIDQITGVKFNWISPNESKRRQVGVIAQDVQKVLPELVETNSETKKLAVNYSGLVAPLIEAVKELYHKWMDDSAAIHRELASVKSSKADQSEVERLKSENQQMKTYLCSKDPAAPFCK